MQVQKLLADNMRRTSRAASTRVAIDTKCFRPSRPVRSRRRFLTRKQINEQSVALDTQNMADPLIKFGQWICQEKKTRPPSNRANLCVFSYEWHDVGAAIGRPSILPVHTHASQKRKHFWKCCDANGTLGSRTTCPHKMPRRK